MAQRDNETTSMSNALQTNKGQTMGRSELSDNGNWLQRMQVFVVGKVKVRDGSREGRARDGGKTDIRGYPTKEKWYSRRRIRKARNKDGKTGNATVHFEFHRSTKVAESPLTLAGDP